MPAKKRGQTKSHTTWAGGSLGAWSKTDWTPACWEVKCHYLADGDKCQGSRLCNHWRIASLWNLDASVKIALPPMDGTDVADWIAAEGAAGAGRKIAALLVDYQPPEVEQPTLPDPPDTPPDDIQIVQSDIGDNTHYRLLGLGGHQHRYHT